MNILVFGGQGFIGHNLVLKLTSEGHNVKVFEKKIQTNKIVDGCDYIEGDFSKISEYEDVFKDIDIVYHMISTTIPQTSNENIEYDIETNLISTTKLLDLSKKNMIKKIIFTSSAGTIYGNPEYLPINENHPTNPICSYGISKLAIEKYLYMYNKLYGLDYQVLRISNPYGPYQDPFSKQGVISVFIGKVLNGENIEVWGDGNISRDYVHIDDVIDALYMVALKNTENKILNIGSGKGTSINTIIDIIQEVLGIKVNVKYKEGRSIDVPINVLDIKKVKESIGWYPKINLYDGVKNTCNWFNKSCKQKSGEPMSKIAADLDVKSTTM